LTADLTADLELELTLDLDRHTVTYQIEQDEFEPLFSHLQRERYGVENHHGYWIHKDGRNVASTTNRRQLGIIEFTVFSYVDQRLEGIVDQYIVDQHIKTAPR
jgi:predicted ATPase